MCIRDSFRALLADHGSVQSMSEADNPYDNAFAESLFSRFKAELIQKGAFESKEDAITEIFDYIEMYYNTQRLHSSLGYVPPVEFEEITKRKTWWNTTSGTMCLPDLKQAERNAFVLRVFLGIRSRNVHFESLKKNRGWRKPPTSVTIPVEQDIPGKLLSSRACFRLPVKMKLEPSSETKKLDYF